MNKTNWSIPVVLFVSLATGLWGCSTNPEKPATATPAESHATLPQARGACGNDPTYTIGGTPYQVLPSAEGYAERGTAAWYGAEYQGAETAGCEVFDMHSFSAAHRTLPLPTFARVTNQQNGKSIIVRINDRGPFESNDLIQLSFAAANALGIKSRSGAPVLVEAIPPQQLPPEALRPPKTTGGKKSQATDKSQEYYVVVGTWPDQNEALDMFVRLTSVGLGKTEMATAKQEGQEMHQVRVGPLYSQDQIDNVRDILESNGLANFKVVAR